MPTGAPAITTLQRRAEAGDCHSAGGMLVKFWLLSATAEADRQAAAFITRGSTMSKASRLQKDGIRSRFLVGYLPDEMRLYGDMTGHAIL